MSQTGAFPTRRKAHFQEEPEIWPHEANPEDPDAGPEHLLVPANPASPQERPSIPLLNPAVVLACVDRSKLKYFVTISKGKQK